MTKSKRKISKRKSRKRRSRRTYMSCKSKLKQKIRINIREYKYANNKQAIAVAYSQIKKKYPQCKNKI